MAADNSFVGLVTNYNFPSFLFLGLKKFLLQHPSLFLVDGEYVNVNDFQIRERGVVPTKDYIQEAKDYFSQKLIQYGSGTEVPVKSLLGHRSQASPQVRHISGQHIKEFTDFLAKHPDTFHVVEDHVTLVNFDAISMNSTAETLHLPQPSIDVKNTQLILDFFAQCIEVKGPILVDQLFHLVTSNFSQEYWFRIFKTPNDLTTFLKLFSDCFNLQSNLVTLLQKPKINENHVHHAQKVLSKNNSNSTPDFKLNEPISNNMMLMVGDVHKSVQSVTSKSGSPSLNDSLSNGRNSTNDLPSIGLPQSFYDIKMENLCTRNCPPKMAAAQNTVRLNLFHH